MCEIFLGPERVEGIENILMGDFLLSMKVVGRHVFRN